MENPPKLNPYEFHLTTKGMLKKVCQEQEMVNLYSPFDKNEYIPFGYSKGGKRDWTLDELIVASQAENRDGLRSDIDWLAAAEDHA